MKLYNHQDRFIKNAPNKWGIWHACGTGKTITGLYKVLSNKNIRNCLIICPKGVLSKWEKECVPHKKYFKVITKEQFRRDWQILSSYDAIIIDEAHHFSSLKSQLYKNIIKFIKKHAVQYIYPMTATPYRREPFNIYALARITGNAWDYKEFQQKWYEPQWFGPRMIWIPKKNIEKKIAELVRKIGDVVSFSECGDMPEINYKIEEITFTLLQKRVLEELKHTEANPLVCYGKEHQIAAGICDGHSSGLKTEKYERLKELAESNKKLAIFCRYTEQIKNINSVLSNLGYTIFIIDGKMKENKSEVADKANKAEEAIVIIQMDSAEGFELPTFDVIVYASMSYSYLSYEQSMGRFIRINTKNNPKLFIYLITKDSIDEAVYENLMKKQDFSIEIYAKTRSEIPNRI